MTRPAVPESETPEVDAALDALAPDQRGAVNYNGRTFIDLARSLERRLSLAQTEIKGHMRVEDELRADLALAQRALSNAIRISTEAQARIAELEKLLGRWLTGPHVINAPLSLINETKYAALKDRA